MKYKLTILFSFFAIACATQKKVEYDLPIGMSPSVIPNFLERYNKGKALYKIICADCHNKKTNGKTVVPDFTPAQLDTYKRNLLNNFLLFSLRQVLLYQLVSLPTDKALNKLTCYFFLYCSYRKKHAAVVASHEQRHFFYLS